MNEDEAREGMKVRIRTDIPDKCWVAFGLYPENLAGKHGVISERWNNDRFWDIVFPDGKRRDTYEVAVSDMDGLHLGYFPPYALMRVCMFEEVKHER